MPLHAAPLTLLPCPLPLPAAGALDCFRKTMQWEGVRGLYKGVSSPLAGQMFFRATLFRCGAGSGGGGAGYCASLEGRQGPLLRVASCECGGKGAGGAPALSCTE